MTEKSELFANSFKALIISYRTLSTICANISVFVL